MGYYTDLWKKQKQSGVYQTTSGGKVYANEAVRQADKAVQAAVQSAQQQQSSGTYKTTSGGTVKSTPKATTTYTPKTTGVTVPTLANTVSFTPTPQPAKTTTNLKQITTSVPNGGALATSDYAKMYASAYRNLPYDPSYVVNKNVWTGATDEEETTPTGSIATSSLGYTIQPKDSFYNRDTALWLLDKYGMTEADLGGVPLEALYTGDHRYTLPYLMKYPDNHTILSDGQLITIGELKQRLTNGMYVPNSGMTATAQTTTPADTYEVEESYYEDDGYSLPDYAQAIIDAQNAQYQALISALQAQSGTLDQQYAGSARDLYANYVRQGLALPEQLAGTATGTADSMLLQNDLNYQNNLYQNELARQAAQQDLQAQINQYGAEAALQSAQTAAEWAQLQWQQEQAEREAEREYQLALAKLQQSSGSKTEEATVETAPSVTAQDYINSNYGRTDFANMTGANIKADLDYLLQIGAMSQAEYNEALKYYKIA